MAQFAAIKTIQNFAEIFIDALFPRDCAACAAPLAGPGPFCPSCAELTLEIESPHCPRCGLPNVESEKHCPDCRELNRVNVINSNNIKHFTRARAIYVYGAVVEQGLRRCKFANAPHIAQMAGHHMAQVLNKTTLGLDLQFNALVPIPVGTQRLRTRGFDQAVLMAQALGEHMQKPVLKHALRRQRETEAQALQSRQKRRKNVQNAFVCLQAKKLKNKKILLIDDVMTTGMTAQAASQALLSAGARQVEVLTFARAILKHDEAELQVA